MENVISINDIQPNPKNPRKIKKNKFQELRKNLLRYHNLMQHRPIVVKKGVVFGGNQRRDTIEKIMDMSAEEFEVLHKSINLPKKSVDFWEKVRKSRSIPEEWVSDADKLTPAELKAFIILDNEHAGQYDWEVLQQEFKMEELTEFGMEVFKTNEPKKPRKSKEGEEEEPHFLHVQLETEQSCQELYERLIGEGYNVKIV